MGGGCVVFARARDEFYFESVRRDDVVDGGGCVLWFGVCGDDVGVNGDVCEG